MDSFLQRRLNDGRYRLQAASRSGPTTAVSTWYESSTVTAAPGATAVVMGEGSVTRYNAAITDGDTGGAKKLKRKKGSSEFTEKQKKELRNRESSDNSDSGGCWSG
jgi:hypothetical protein